jgi:hypothetical protein
MYKLLKCDFYIRKLPIKIEILSEKWRFKLKNQFLVLNNCDINRLPSLSVVFDQ